MDNTQNGFWKYDNDGGMNFSTQDDVLKSTQHSENHLSPKKILFSAVCFINAAIDIVVIYMLFTLLINDNILFRIIASSGLFVGFDIAPIILGDQLKNRDFGLKISRLATTFAIIAFITAVMVNLDLRMNVETNTVDSAKSENLVGDYSTEEETQSQDSTSQAMARAFSIFPIITSLVSFAASYQISDPLKKKLQVAEKNLLKYEKDMYYSEAALSEFEDRPTYETLIEEDQRLLTEAINKAYITGKLYADHARMYLLELIETSASGINVATEFPQEDYDVLMNNNSDLLITSDQDDTINSSL